MRTVHVFINSNRSYVLGLVPLHCLFLDNNILFEYKSTTFCSAQCSGTLVFCNLDNYVVVGVYGALTIGCVRDMPFCDEMRMLRMRCHGEVM